MFDNPNEQLKRLEDQLLQAEMTDDEFESFYGEIMDEFGPVEEDEDLLADSPVNNVRNYANDYGRAQQPRNPAPRGYHSGAPAYGGDMDEDMDEERYVAAPQKEKSLKGLIICACLECLGIVGVVLWWLLRIL